MIQIVVALATLYFSGHSSIHAEEPLPLDLPGAVQFALTHSPTLDSANKALAMRHLDYRTAVARMAPSLDLSTQVGLQNPQPFLTAAPPPSTTGNLWISSLNLSVTETLYDNGVSWTQMLIADGNRELAEVARLKERDHLILQVATEFYRFSQAHALLEPKKQIKAALDHQLQMIASKYRQGLRTKEDFLRLQAQVQAAEIELISAQNAIQLSEAELRKLLGFEVQSTQLVRYTPVIVSRKAKINTLLGNTVLELKNTYDFRASELQNNLNEKQVRLARRQLLPRASLSGGIGYTNSNFLGSNLTFAATGQANWNLQLTLQYNIWDWGIRRRDLEAAQINLEIQTNGIRRNLMEVQNQIANLTLEEARLTKSFALSQQLLGLEEETNLHLEERYREGKVSYLDYVASLNSLLSARNAFVASYFEAMRLKANHRYLEGRIYDWILEK